MKNLIKIVALIVSVLTFSNIFSMEQQKQQQPSQQRFITRVIKDTRYTYDTNENTLYAEIGGVRIVLSHPNQADASLYAVDPISNARIGFPAIVDIHELYDVFMQRLATIQQPENQGMIASAKNFVLHYGLPIRLDVNPLEALKNEFQRLGLVWNQTYRRTFFILLGEVAMVYCLLQLSSGLGYYANELNNGLIPALNPNSRLRPGYTSSILGRSSAVGGSLASLYLMSMIHSYGAVWGLHAAEDLLCLIGSTVWTYLQALQQ